MNIKKKLFDIRQDYEHNTLSEIELSVDPFNLFKRWIDEAIQLKVDEPTAMNLSTVDETGQPSGRIVLLKDIAERSLSFFTNYESRKANHLKNNPRAAVTFFWPRVERQIRIEGVVSFCESAVSNLYFESRPYESRVSALASPQSKVILSREELLANYRVIEQKYGVNSKIPRPENWGGYELKPHLFEFWQGGKYRLHDRFEYRLIDNHWLINRLAP